MSMYHFLCRFPIDMNPSIEAEASNHLGLAVAERFANERREAPGSIRWLARAFLFFN